MSQQMPMVTILMPVYNAAVYLREAIESILSQTFTDFEFLIINDGSTDESAEILDSYQDRRLRVIHNQKNQGLIATLNEGLAESKGRYIVRMDGDDISMPDRIARQVTFMEAHPELGLSGTWFEDFGPGIPSRIITYSDSDTEIRIRHLYQTHIAHPTAIIRKSILDAHHLQFDPEYVHGEDYHFWVCLSRFCKLSNINEVLVRKRDHPANVSNRFAEIQRVTCNKVKRLQFSWMGIEISPEEAEVYSRFANTEWNFSVEEMNSLSILLHKIDQANQHSGLINREAFRDYLAAKWFHLCLNNPGLGPKRMKIFKMLSFRKVYPGSVKSRVRLVLKTISG